VRGQWNAGSGLRTDIAPWRSSRFWLDGSAEPIDRNVRYIPLAKG